MMRRRRERAIVVVGGGAPARRGGARARAAALAVTLALGSAACFKERERIDVPSLTVTLDDTLVAAGDTIRGQLHATDGSGLLLVRVRAESAIDTVLQRADLLEEHDVQLSFTIPIVAATPVDGRIQIQVSVVDNQDFEVVADTAVRVKAP